MSNTGISGRRCGPCGEPLVEDEGVGPCKKCWAILVPYRQVSEEVAASLKVMAECRHSLEILKTAPKRGEKMVFHPTNAFRLEILHNYSVELASLFTLRARQRELCMKLELRRNMKRD